MGQYWKVVNLDKKEYLNPHKLGCGLKLWEQLANHPSTGSALIILCAAMPEPRGGGDFDLTGPDDYPVVAKRTIGRWAGARIAFVGDYTKDSDLPAEFKASEIYRACSNPTNWEEDDPAKPLEFYKDITDDVCRVIERELGGKFEGVGWRNFIPA